MSEYQYYEFQALDRPLDNKAQAALRKITSRAEITATSLINVYHFGDFKGDPKRLMEQYFDAFLYLANWGSRWIMLRLPLAGLSLAEVKPYCREDDFSAWQTAEHVILSYHFRDEGGDHDFDTEGPGCLTPIIPLREELLRGDRRPLYLGWLLAVEQAYLDEGEEEAFEPPVPPGLGSLSGPQQALVEFLRIDPHLLAAAAERSAHLESKPGPAELKEQAHWVKSLPAGEKDDYLLRLLRGEGTYLSVEVQRRFLTEQAGKRRKDSSQAEGPPRRSIAELRARAKELRKEEQRRREERRRREREERDRQAAEARKRHLDSLVGSEDRLWRQVEALVQTKQPGKYDEAVSALLDLRDLAERAGTMAAFGQRLQALRDSHARKVTFIERLDRAKLS